MCSVGTCYVVQPVCVIGSSLHCVQVHLPVVDVPGLRRGKDAVRFLKPQEHLVGVFVVAFRRVWMIQFAQLAIATSYGGVVCVVIQAHEVVVRSWCGECALSDLFLESAPSVCAFFVGFRGFARACAVFPRLSSVASRCTDVALEGWKGIFRSSFAGESTIERSRRLPTPPSSHRDVVASPRRVQARHSHRQGPTCLSLSFGIRFLFHLRIQPMDRTTTPDRFRR